MGTPMSRRAVSSATFTQLPPFGRREMGGKIARTTGMETRPALISAPNALRRLRKLRRPSLPSPSEAGTCSAEVEDNELLLLTFVRRRLSTNLLHNPKK